MQRAPTATGQGPALQEGTCIGLCPMSSNPGEPRQAVPLTQGQLGPASSGAGPSPGEASTWFWLRLQSEDQAVLARGVHAASCLWPLALVTALDGARAPGGSPGLDQSWGCHCRDHQVLLHCKGSGPSGSKVQGRDDTTEVRVEVTGLSHGFLMVQIEVSLLPSESEPWA